MATVTDAQRAAFAREAPQLWVKRRDAVDTWLSVAGDELFYAAMASALRDTAVALYAAHRLQLVSMSGLDASPGVVTSTGSGSPASLTVQPRTPDPAVPADLYQTRYGARLADLILATPSLSAPVALL